MWQNVKMFIAYIHSLKRWLLSSLLWITNTHTHSQPEIFTRLLSSTISIYLSLCLALSNIYHNKEMIIKYIVSAQWTKCIKFDGCCKLSHRVSLTMLKRKRENMKRKLIFNISKSKFIIIMYKFSVWLATYNSNSSQLMHIKRNHIV